MPSSDTDTTSGLFVEKLTDESVASCGFTVQLRAMLRPTATDGFFSLKVMDVTGAYTVTSICA